MSCVLGVCFDFHDDFLFVGLSPPLKEGKGLGRNNPFSLFPFFITSQLPNDGRRAAGHFHPAPRSRELSGWRHKEVFLQDWTRALPQGAKIPRTNPHSHDPNPLEYLHNARGNSAISQHSGHTAQGMLREQHFAAFPFKCSIWALGLVFQGLSHWGQTQSEDQQHKIKTNTNSNTSYPQKGVVTIEYITSKSFLGCFYYKITIWINSCTTTRLFLCQCWMKRSDPAQPHRSQVQNSPWYVWEILWAYHELRYSLFWWWIEII